MGGTLDDLIRRALAESEEGAYSYLQQRWLNMAMGELRQARREAGLSQADVAARLDTTQSAIARLENDHEGRVSLRRYVAYALACGMLPLEVELEPAEEVRAAVLACLGRR